MTKQQSDKAVELVRHAVKMWQCTEGTGAADLLDYICEATRELDIVTNAEIGKWCDEDDAAMAAE